MLAVASDKLGHVYEGPDRRNDDERGFRTTRSGISPALIAFAIIVVLAVIFVVQNGVKAEIKFLFVERSTPVWVAIAIAIAIGVLLDRLLSVWWRRRRRHEHDR